MSSVVEIDIWSDGVVDLIEAQRLLGSKERKVYSLMDSGELPFTRVGNRRKIPRVGIIEYLKKNSVNGDALS